MRLNRTFAVLFVIILALSPILGACRGRPTPAPTTNPPTAAAPAATTPKAIVPTNAPTVPPSPTPTRRPLPPTVVWMTPAPGEEHRVDAPVTIDFDQAMDPASTQKAFTIEPSAEGKVTVEGRRLTFTPQKPLRPATQYRVTVDASASSAGGLKMLKPAAFQLSTVGDLQVTGNQPADKANEVAVDSAIVVSFNRPVTPLTGVREQAGLPQPLVITPTIAGRGEWLSTSIYQFRPEGGLAASTNYTVTVPAGLTGVAGARLDESHTFSFSTDRPRVVSWQPERSMNVKIEAVITVTFSMPMDRQITERAFSLEIGDHRPVTGTMTWNRAGTELGFRPAGRLAFGTNYVATVGRAARAASGPGSTGGTLDSDASYVFTTVPLPKIARTEPTQSNQAADPYGGVMFQFAGPMDPASMITGTYTILPRPTEVYTAYNEYDNQFYLNFAKLPATAYTVTLSGRVADPYGNTLGEDYVLRFKTRDYEPSLQLSSPGPVGTYNAYTTTEAVVIYQNVAQIDFRLFSVPTTNFLKLTGRNYWEAINNYRPTTDDLVHAWSTPTRAARNRQGIIRSELTDGAGRPLAPGLYYLEVVGPGSTTGKVYNAQRQLLARTDLNVTLKSSETGALVWVTDLKSGLPAAGVTVKFVDGDKVDTSAVTDQDGVAEVTFERRERTWEPLMALATGKEGQMGVASSIWEDGISPWNFNLGGGQTASQMMGYVYTDRPIYRPGQTVYWKAIIRQDDDARYSLPPAGLPVTVTIIDDQGNKVQEQGVRLSPMGTADGKLELGTEAIVGYYNISVMVAKDLQYSVGFQVAEYRKPEYEINAQTDRPEYIQGDQIQAYVSASYFFGGPVKNAKVRWAVLSSDYGFEYKPPSGQEGERFYYTFGDWDWFDWERGRTFGGPVSQGEGTTDARGYFTVTVPADIARFRQSQRFSIDFTVIDANNQAVSAQATAVVHKGEFYIGLHPESYVAEANRSNTVDLLTVDTQSRPAPKVELTVIANRITWYTVREQSEDGQYYLISKPRQTPFYTQTITTGSDGTATLQWRPDAAGEYKIEAYGRDRLGHQIRGAAFVWASSGEYAYWRQENNDRIQLVADKDEYVVGDTARVLVASPYQGTVKALVTIERNHVLTHQVVDLQGNSQILQVPIAEEHAPNVFVSIMLVKGMEPGNVAPSFKMGLTQLKVSVADKQLHLTVTPDHAKVGPRDTVTWNIDARDAAGKAVPDAEVSLALVDKAILTLATDQAGSLMDRFYSQRALGVRTAGTLVVNIDRLVSQLSRGAAKGGGGGGGGGLPPVRREFPDVAYWNATATTGPDGKAQLEVKLPDNLTTWVMDGRAVTANTLVGQAKSEVMATKDLLVRPVLPRFFVQGDQAEVAAIVQNNTSHPVDAVITIQTTGVQVTGGDQSVQATIAAGGSYKTAWPVTVAPSPGDPALLEQAKVQFGVRAGSLQDAVEMTLPVERYETPEVTGTSGQVALDESRLELVRFPADADTSRGEVDVTLEPSLAAGMQGGLTYLEHYPYECVEQTVSRFLPNVVTYQALKSLGINRPDLQAALPQQVAVGLQRIYARQHVDGGWGWWQQDESNLFITSYVLFGLAKAQKAGFTVDEEVMKRGVRFMNRGLEAPGSLKPYEINQQAFMLYALALAGNPQPNRAGALFEARDKLSLYAKGYLALALAQINDEASQDRIKTLLADLVGKASASATTAHWEEEWVDYWNMNTDTRTTSIIVDVLSTLDPKNALAPNAVRWLMTARKAERWETTQENAWAIMALTDWMMATGELEGNYDWQVKVNDRQLGQGSVTPQNVGDAIQLRAGIKELLVDQTNSLEIERTAETGQTGKGQLYYTAHLKSYLPVEKLEAQSRGVTVSRVYQLADCGQSGTAEQPGPGDNNPKKLTENTCPTIESARVGDVIDVKVSVVVPNTVHYLVVEDPLPAGTESIDTSLRTTSRLAQGPQMQRNGPADGQDSTRWWPYWWWNPTHTELRDEKTVMFSTELMPGSYEFSYQIRATLPGKFLTLPPTAYAMYYPEVQGRGAGSIFTVTEP